MTSALPLSVLPVFFFPVTCLPPSSCCQMLLSSRAQLRPASAAEEAPPDPTPGDAFTCGLPHHVCLGPECLPWAVVVVHSSLLTGISASPPSRWRVKPSTKTQARGCHSCAQDVPLAPSAVGEGQHSPGPQALQSPPLWLPPHTQCSNLDLTFSPYSGCFFTGTS